MKKKVKTRKKITLQSVIMYILLILTALMFATPMLFTLLSSIKTKVEILRNHSPGRKSRNGPTMWKPGQVPT